VHDAPDRGKPIIGDRVRVFMWRYDELCRMRNELQTDRVVWPLDQCAHRLGDGDGVATRDLVDRGACQRIDQSAGDKLTAVPQSGLS
jgi:hypothetical protein